MDFFYNFTTLSNGSSLYLKESFFDDEFGQPIEVLATGNAINKKGKLYDTNSGVEG